MKKEQEGKVLTDAQKEAIVDHAIQLINNGESISKTCEITGISRWTLRNYARKSVKTFHPRDGNQPPSMERYLDGGVSSKVRIDTTCQNENTRTLECICVCGTIRRVKYTNLMNKYSLGCGCRNVIGGRKQTPWICRNGSASI